METGILRLYKYGANQRVTGKLIVASGYMELN
jgi:hypothetical protein